MDPLSIVVAGGAYFGLKDLVPRILGPTADYLGAGMRSYSEKGAANLRRIFQNAGEKIGDRLNEPGQVAPKVLKDILEEGYVSEDELAAEYFGGVLASSRTTNARDDRGAAFVKLVSRLSVYQLRMHHVFYATVRKRHLGKTLNLYEQTVRKQQLKTFLSFEAVVGGLDLSESENPNTLIPHIIHGLVREELIEDTFRYGGIDHVRKEIPDASAPGMVLTPSPLGIELYLWAYGKGDLTCEALLDRSVTFKPLAGIVYPG
jgi:hypothetical protein